MITRTRYWLIVAAAAMFVASCGDGDSASSDSTDEPATTEVTEVAEDTEATEDTEVTEDTAATEDTEAPASDGSGFTDEGRTIDAVEAAIVVDGDSSDWADIEGLDMTLAPIMDEDLDSHDATLKVAHDGENVYVLFQVEDDYNWDPEDAHLSAASAVQWAIDPGAGEGMGATDADRETSLGMVDIWHWELECASGEPMGGAVSDAGDGDLGNDAGCNFDDEYALQTEEREDDNADGAENSFLGVWSHSAAAADEDGTWTFEISRPLDTGDSTDAQFAAGSEAQVAVAYWDPDTRPEGWDDDHHVMSANQGWITVRFV